MNLIKELYNYREMLFSLVRKSLRGRYKGSILGFLWTFLIPLLQLGVYTLVFSVIMKAGYDRYYLFLFTALVPWVFFSSAVSSGTGCIWDQRDMVNKIYFPREILPIAHVTYLLVNMLLSLLIVFAVLIFSGHGVNFTAILYLPVVIFIEYLLALGITMLMSALDVYFRDLQYIMEILVMAWQFLTPVMYGLDAVPEELRVIFHFNPMTSVIECFRDIMYYKQIPDITTLGLAAFMGIFFMTVGTLTFGQLKKDFRRECKLEPENVIDVNNVRKSFKVYKDRGYMLKEMVLFSNRRKYEIHDVLNGISFHVKKGEAVGLIGQNGCGKSTTLKLLTKIIYPDSGSIELRGRVSSLLELGAGFHPDMSGRENIYINASIFGLTRDEIAQRLDDIIAFSELEEYIDNPVRTYSSGMYMRLAFSVAINVDADILLIDEILAVGDANFQSKCFNRLKEIKAEGTTIVIVSHSLGQIEQICERSIWIHDGRIMEEGTPREVHPIYLDYMGTKRLEIAKQEAVRQKKKEGNEITETGALDDNKDPAQVTQVSVVENEKDDSDDLRTISTAEALKKNKKRWGNGMARFQKIELLDENKTDSSLFETGKSIEVKLHYRVKQKVDDAVIGIGIYRTDGVYVYGSNTRIDKQEKFSLERDGIISIKLKNINLMPGQYTMDFAIESGMGIPVDYYREARKVEFFTTRDDVGLIRLEHEWVYEC